MILMPMGVARCNERSKNQLDPPPHYNYLAWSAVEPHLVCSGNIVQNATHCRGTLLMADHARTAAFILAKEIIDVDGVLDWP